MATDVSRFSTSWCLRARFCRLLPLSPHARLPSLRFDGVKLFRRALRVCLECCSQSHLAAVLREKRVGVRLRRNCGDLRWRGTIETSSDHVNDALHTHKHTHKHTCGLASGAAVIGRRRLARERSAVWQR